MTTMLVVTTIVACVGVGLLTYLVIVGPDTARAQALANLAAGAAHPSRAHARRSLSGRPARHTTLNHWVPRGELALIDRLLAEAGRPATWPLDRVVSIKMWSTVITLVLALLLVMRSPGAGPVLLSIFVVVLVYFVPELRLWSIGLERRETMTRELADILDQMGIAVEAGLGFEAALVRVSNTSNGVLAAEFRRTVQDMQVGQPRREAYLALARRTKVPELSRFIRTIVQADESGLPLTDVLRTQSAEMRLIRRQRAEHQAMKIPVKVIFPLAFCIFPVLFIVILGPAGLSIMEAFKM